MQKHSMIGKERKNNTSELLTKLIVLNLIFFHLLRTSDLTCNLKFLTLEITCTGYISTYSYLNLVSYIRAVQLTEILR